MIEPRVFYRAGGCYCIGPLGVWDRGQEVSVEGVECVVARIDPDGAGIACEPDVAPVRFPCKGLDVLLPRQREQVRNQILANRRDHGLSAIDPRST